MEPKDIGALIAIFVVSGIIGKCIFNYLQYGVFWVWVKNKKDGSTTGN